MKLRPLQIIGLVAIVVFGGIFAYLQFKPKRDPFTVPGAVPLTEAPAPIPTPAPAPDPLTVGSQDARDDLYCSGILYVVHRSKDAAVTAEDGKRLDYIVALAKSGVDKLIAEGAATTGTSGAIADAQTDEAEAALMAGSPRISEADCTKRAEALPPAN